MKGNQLFIKELTTEQELCVKFTLFAGGMCLSDLLPRVCAAPLRCHYVVIGL